ncbi:hypothetical protein VTI74DRAFT_4066 [Chaetomium olivicolor]
MFDTNPNLVQEYHPPKGASPWSKEPTPLILIHDGGGTIFSYYCLGDLGRAVYGISNPHFQSGKAWEGGIPEMARQYIKFIKKAVPKGNVIIGGWSLGGLISLEVARQLAEEKGSGLNLLGIVMIDSVCPVVLTEPALPVVQHAVQWGEHTKHETKERVTRCFEHATKMVRDWTLPTWGDEEAQDKEGKNGFHGSVRSPKGRPPPVVLLRAMDRVPVSKEGVSRVDIHREDQLLGWGNYRKDLITKVMDIPGHHFNIFHTDESLETTTEGIKMACSELETLNSLQ